MLRLGAACNNLFFVSHKVGGILLMEDAMIPLILTVLQLPNIQNTQVASIGNLRYKKTHANKLQSLLNHVINFFVY